jgi:hypothetical protein
MLADQRITGIGRRNESRDRRASRGIERRSRKNRRMSRVVRKKKHSGFCYMIIDTLIPLPLLYM